MIMGSPSTYSFYLCFCIILFTGVDVNASLGRSRSSAAKQLAPATTNGVHPFLGLQHVHDIQRTLMKYQTRHSNKNGPNGYRSLQEDNSASASLVVTDNTNADNAPTPTTSTVTVNDNNEINDPTPTFDLETMCHIIEQSFSTNVTCTCAGNVIDNFSITCDYLEPLCSTTSSTTSSTATKTCGVIQIAISMVQLQVFSSTTCISEYTRNNVPLNNTCIFVDTCAAATTSATRFLDGTTENKNVELQPSFCSCTAMYGDTICNSCQICPGTNSEENSSAMSIDCRNVNAEAISQQCTPIDLDLHLSEDENHDTNGSDKNHISGFVPQMDGFCTQLENTMNNTIRCDCTNAISGSYNISCETNDRVCVDNNVVVDEDESSQSSHCGVVQSTVAVNDGTIDTVTACVTYDTAVFAKDGGKGKTCTTMHLCTKNDSNDDDVCSCSATYNDAICTSCIVVPDGSTLQPPLLSDTTYIQLDCSNIQPKAITNYQPIYASSSYEFIPFYEAMNTNKNDLSFGGDNTKTSSSTIGSHESIQLAIQLIAVTIFTATI